MEEVNANQITKMASELKIVVLVEKKPLSDQFSQLALTHGQYVRLCRFIGEQTQTIDATGKVIKPITVLNPNQEIHIPNARIHL